jgi:Ca-activated chloride channel family protein
VTFLGPLTFSTWAYVALGAAALAVGAYIIKMRRRRFEVPFSELWKRVLEQKDASALWKQLRRMMSLLLILLILGLVLFAALDPTLGAIDRKARSVVILVDASASMKTLDETRDNKPITRMDAAKQRAKQLIDSMGGGDVAMIVKVDGQATPMSRFSSDGRMLDKIVDGISASDTPADLSRALAAAADALRDRKNPLIVIVSDGAYPQTQLSHVTWQKSPDMSLTDLTGIDVRYLPVGKRSDNVGIVAFNVRRYIANKAAYEVYVEIQNFGQEPAHRTLTLFNGQTPVLTASGDNGQLDLAPGQKVSKIFPKLPGGEGQLRAALRPVDGAGGSDPFALDDTAYALLPERKKQKVMMITNDNLFLEGALLVYDNINPTKFKPAEYEANPSIADGQDVVIFDDYTPSVVPLPPTSLLYFHPTGEHSPIKVGKEVASPKVTEVDESHPVMRWVTMADVYMDKSNTFAIEPKQGESALAYFAGDAVVAAKRDGKRKILAFGFSLPSQGRDSATDLPMRVAFPMLLVNALDWFAGDQTDLLTTYPTGSRERVPLDGVVGATDAEVKGPDGAMTHTPVVDGLATFYGSRVGFYDLAAKDQSGATIAQISLAANLASPAESDITPSQKLSLGGKQLEEPEAFAITHSQKLWLYFIGLAAILLVLEWITYHRRITV